MTRRGTASRSALYAAVFALSSVLASLAARGASAQEEASLEEAYSRAQEREHAHDPRGAREAWREVMAIGPGSRMAARAARRVAWLDERSDADFGPLEALLNFQAREDRTLAAAEAFEARIASMPAGRVRIEAHLALAQAFGSLGETERASAIYRAVLDEEGLRSDEAVVARDELAGVLASGGDVDAALSELESSGLEHSARHGVLLRNARRRFLEPLAWSAIALFVVLVVGGIQKVRGLSRARAALADPWAIATCAFVAGFPYLVARILSDEAAGAFLVLGIANAIGMALSFAAGGAFRGAPRHTLSAVSITAVLAAVGVGYLAVLYQAPSLPFA